MSEPAPPSPPRRTINDLPTELKQRIVELCAEQDEWYKQWLAALKEQNGIGAEVDVVKLRKGNALLGHSVNALFQVSRLFSAPAAPYVFQVLSSTRMDVHFRCLIAATRLPLFTTLRIAGGDLTEPIVALPQLTNLKTLIFEDIFAADGYLGTPSQPSPHRPIAAYAATAFKKIRGLSTLIIHNVHLPFFAELFPLWSGSLSKLDITYAFDYLDELEKLGPTVSAATQLEELRLSVKYDDEDEQADISPLHQSITSFPPVQRLSLTSQFPHASHLSFAHSFSSTLLHLSLSATIDAEGEPFFFNYPRFTTEVFPHVATLSVAGEYNAVRQPLASMERRHFPSLDTLTLNLTFVDNWRTALSFLEGFPGLATLALPNFSRFPPEERAVIRAVAAEHGVALHANVELGNFPQLAAPTVNAALEDTAEPTLASKCAAVQATLDFVGARLASARETGDEEFVKKATTALRELELERAAGEVWSKV
ncbi:hypothetical protein JCM6882_001511 [Rhodosporidiobolus microsporus]